jgi:hypothetical protein
MLDVDQYGEIGNNREFPQLRGKNHKSQIVNGKLATRRRSNFVLFIAYCVMRFGISRTL